jgi:hypothetical protein
LSIFKQKRIITQTINNSKKLIKGGVNPYLLVNQAYTEISIANFDKQVLESYFQDSLWGESYEYLLERLEKSKISTKELYERIYKNQLGIDL